MGQEDIFGEVLEDGRRKLSVNQANTIKLKLPSLKGYYYVNNHFKELLLLLLLFFRNVFLNNEMTTLKSTSRTASFCSLNDEVTNGVFKTGQFRMNALLKM